MDYTPPPTKLADRQPVSIDDIATFFADYIRTDNLGVVAHAHVAHADASPLGAGCDKCLRLAALHSTAVDFAKTGVRVLRLCQSTPCKRCSHDLRRFWS